MEYGRWNSSHRANRKKDHTPVSVKNIAWGWTHVKWIRENWETFKENNTIKCILKFGNRFVELRLYTKQTSESLQKCWVKMDISLKTKQAYIKLETVSNALKTVKETNYAKEIEFIVSVWKDYQHN